MLAPNVTYAAGANIDELFIARHIKFLVIFVSVSIIILSCLFAFILQYFVLSNTTVHASANLPKEIATPTPLATPTPTNIPVDKAEIKIIVLNGTDTKGAAKAVAQKLTTEGFSVIKSDNAPQNVQQTIITYPEGKKDGADALEYALQSDYPNIIEKVASDSSTFTLTLGQ